MAKLGTLAGFVGPLVGCANGRLEDVLPRHLAGNTASRWEYNGGRRGMGPAMSIGPRDEGAPVEEDQGELEGGLCNGLRGLLGGRHQLPTWGRRCFMLTVIWG